MKNIFFFLLIMVLFMSCKENYHVNVDTPDTGYLVVEGYVSLDTHSPTSFRLSRTTKLDTSFVKYESGAIVMLESDNNMSYQLHERSTGIYSTDSMTLSAARKYRIHIITSNKKAYRSDFSASKICPAIDSINWKVQGSDVKVYASTHDAQNQTIYYLWNYEETWEYRSKYQSSIVYNEADASFSQRNLLTNNIHKCWRGDASTNIILSSTAKLASDVVFEKQIVAVPMVGTDKLVSLYSILVRQFALTKEAYNYLDLMRKNTEQIGSIFDAQPSQLKGNIHNMADSTEIVIGFVYTTSTTEKRKFIYRSDLPPNYIETGYETCPLDTVENNEPKIRQLFDGGNVLGVETIYSMGLLVGYSYSTPYCVDCRVKGGTTKKPDYWP